MVEPVTAPSADPVPASPDEDNPARNTAVRTSKMEDAAYAQRVRSWYKDAYSHDKDAREEEEEDWRFFAGHQWKDEHVTERSKDGRPTLTVNYCLPIVNAVVGEERLNRQQITIYGRDYTDDLGSSAMQEVIRWIMYGSNGDYAVSKMFRSTAVTGRGWVEVRVNWLDDPEGMIEVREVPRKEMYVDPISREEDLSDARYLVRERWLTEDEIEAMWPDKIAQVKALKASWGTEAGSTLVEIPGTDKYSRSNSKIHNEKEGTWQCLEAWHWEVLPGAVVVNDQTGQLEELTRPELEAVTAQRNQEIEAATLQNQQAAVLAQEMATMSPGMAMLPPEPMPVPPPIQSSPRPIKRYFQGFIIGNVVLQRGESPHKYLKRFPYIPCFGMRDEDKERWFGLIRPIKDPQRQHNVEQSAILQWTQQMPKGGWMAPKGAFVDRHRWEQKSSQAGFIGEYNANRGKPEPIRPPTLPRHVLELAPTRLQNMRDISGVNVDLMGNTQKDSPGVVMELRRKQALTVLQTLFDNLRLSRRILGQVLIAFIQQYMADGRMVRVVGQPTAQYIALTKDLQFAKFDAVVEDSPDSPTDKMATMYILQTTLPILAKMGIPIPPSFVDLLPISPHIRQEWRALIEQTMMGPALPPGAPPPAGAPSGPTPPPAG
jgi:hypothetical protein